MGDGFSERYPNFLNCIQHIFPGRGDFALPLVTGLIVTLFIQKQVKFSFEHCNNLDIVKFCRCSLFF